MFTTLAELAFTNKIGFDVFLKEHTNNVENIFAELFSEECGLVIQVLAEREDEILEYIKANNIQFTHCGTQNSSLSISVIQDGKAIFKDSIISLEKIWSETSFAIKSLRDNPNRTM